LTVVPYQIINRQRNEDGCDIMGIFSKLVSKVKPETNVDIALQLFESQGIGGTIGTRAKAIISDCQSRQDVLLRAIELCGPNPIDAKSLYVVSHCYVWLGAKYRPQAIEYLEKYIAAGASWSGTPRDVIDMGGYSVDQLSSNRASVYHYLGKAYEGEYMFEKAENAYREAESLCPDFATYSVCVANTFVKRNDLERAKAYLNSKKQTIYYKNNVDDYKTLLNAALNDINSKIEKGYVYKPRGKSRK